MLQKTQIPFIDQKESGNLEHHPGRTDSPQETRSGGDAVAIGVGVGVDVGGRIGGVEVEVGSWGRGDFHRHTYHMFADVYFLSGQPANRFALSL